MDAVRAMSLSQTHRAFHTSPYRHTFLALVMPTSLPPPYPSIQRASNMCNPAYSLPVGLRWRRISQPQRGRSINRLLCPSRIPSPSPGEAPSSLGASSKVGFSRRMDVGHGHVLGQISLVDWLCQAPLRQEKTWTSWDWARP